MTPSESNEKDSSGDIIIALTKEITRLKEELKLAIEHDRQPYPTADAYEKVCAALSATKKELAEMKEKREKELGEAYEAGVWWHIDGGRWSNTSDNGFIEFLASRKERS